MRRYILITTVGAAAAVVFAAAALANHGGSHGKGVGGNGGVRCVLNTQLKASNEPPVLSTAKGQAQLKVWNNGKLSFNVHILNKARETFTAGHIHLTATGLPIQNLLTGASDTARHIRVKGTVTIDPALATGLCTTAANYYVNFHTTADPVGAIRGNFPA